MKKKPEKIKTALIGCGRIGYLLEKDPLRKKPCTHYAGAISAGLEISAACDINPGRLALFRAETGLPPGAAFTDYRKLITHAAPGILIIATPTETHSDICLYAVRHGVRVIILEKPVCGSLKKAALLMKAAAERGCTIIINHERRYDPRYRAAKKIISSGRLGEIKTIHASVLSSGHRGPSLPDLGGGPLLHDGTHLVDMLRFFAGEISSVAGKFFREGRSSGFEDRAVAWIRSQNGAEIFMEAGGGRDYFLFELDISCTRGRLVIGNGYEKLYISRKSRFYSGFRDPAPAPFPGFSHASPFTVMYREARDIFGKKKQQPSSSIEDGYRALEIINAVYLSSSRSSRSILPPLKPGVINLKKIFSIGQA